MSNTPLQFVRGAEESIPSKITDGYVYYAYDTGRIYMDKGKKRYSMGSGSANGASIYFGHYGKEIFPDDTTDKYHYPLESLEELDITPNIDDVILDDWGALYRILNIKEDYCICSLLPLSGGGGGGGGWGTARPSLKINDIATSVIINGQPFEISCTIKSALDENKQPLTNSLKLHWSLIDEYTGQTYYTGVPVDGIAHESTVALNVGTYLKESTATLVEMYVSGYNHDENSLLRTVSITTVEMYLEQTSSYNPASTYPAGNTVLSCNAMGSLSKILDWVIDGEVVQSETLSKDSVNPRTLRLTDKATHGYHTVEVQLYQNLGTADKPIRGMSTTPLKYEIAVVKSGDSTQLPIIWLGDYKNEYYNYDNIQIPFLVYNPANTAQVEVHLYKDGIDINNGDPITIKNFDDFYNWQIADADLNRLNSYSVSCGQTIDTTVVREITFTVVQDPNRDMTIVRPDNLKLNFDPVGRSNSEPAIRRQTWSYGEGDSKIVAQFNDFNWYNNGWYRDNDTKDTFLRISNGAEFRIPFGPLSFGTGDTSQQSNSIEVAFKMRNIQDYSNLITNVTRYDGDDNWYADFLAQKENGYNNYDAFLQATLTPDQYENLKFLRVQKDVNLRSLACGFYKENGNNITGVCIGPQDTFFSNGQDTVSVSFVENEMIYMSYVYDHSLKLLFIYINGAITGVIQSTVTGNAGFTIDTNDIVFKSDFCDIDLYKLRIYNTALSVNDIVTNHAVDKKDVVIYDQNGLAVNNNMLKEYQFNFDKMVEYNREHPGEPLMPYIVFDTTSTSDDKMPYTKRNDAVKVKVEFINAPLDAAYARGELVQKAIDDKLLDPNESDLETINKAVATYYKHNCPSFTSTMSADDMVNLEVQGTSSEFYPRRNFKLKTKLEMEDGSNFCCWDPSEGEGGAYTEDECLNIFMHKGPYEEIFAADQEQLKANRQEYYGYEESRLSDGWYMNNYTNPTDRWTLKIDYMESSGSYNAAFASLMGTAYTKHPLQDYVNKGVLENTNKLESAVLKKMNWSDYRTSLLGFPIMAFQKRYVRKYEQNSNGDWVGRIVEPKQTETIFIGYYRMLLDKGSDQVLGFKPDKKITHKLLDNAKVRDIAECWEFSTNARTFCSYRDPWERVELSFKAPRGLKLDGFITLEGGKTGGPMVLNHFEPRYFWAEDYLKNDEDGFYNFGNLSQEKVTEICKELEIEDIDITSDEAPYLAQDAAVNLMGNWEKVCKWIYSTDLQNVLSQGTYTPVPVGTTVYAKNLYYTLVETEVEVETEDGIEIVKKTEYVLCQDENFDPTKIYYEGKDSDGDGTLDNFIKLNMTTSEYAYEPNVFYIEIDGAFSLCQNEQFDSSLTYYEFTSLSDEAIAEIADLLVAPATGTYDANTTYYTYDSDAKIVRGGGKTKAVAVVENSTAEEFNAGKYYVANPVVYGSTTYKYDTKEYRTAKFINELTKHFDPEYLATYFVMTEVFECYDSRGKNCMMASWGPLEAGGDYIWYPIFYDIDTQLGINNTGIPSFEFNVDATDAGNYSTSDSILWNNFYKFFKGSYILNKYKNLRGSASNLTALADPPLQSVNKLEEWYTFDPNTTKNIANKGKRPLIATNLDMYWKYITITNPNAAQQGVAYVPGADGAYGYDSKGTYFYALQGDRSQSRRNFLTNRIEYIDSWLNQGNYARGGNNRIRGRIAANNLDGSVLSDKWIETADSSYWVDDVEFGQKRHDFDGEYWLNLQPIRSSYVTAGDDSANYPSQKYDGANAVKFKLKDIESGIRRSANYPEQLVYIYGMNQMSDFGNLNNLYFTEFYMEGKADHLTRLQLGYDGFSKTDTEDNIQWYNKKLNGITLTHMPLLKEANFSRIGLSTETTLDLTQSEKLENFRAAGTSKLTDVAFAEGVALNTLYLPASIASLKLIQANLLDNLIEQATAPHPTYDAFGNELPPEQGLYLEGFFGSDEFASSIRNIHLEGGKLGYGSYKILTRFYDRVSSGKITMTGVDWSPFEQLTEGAEYDSSVTYFIDDGHYGITTWPTPHEVSQFNHLVLNGKLYVSKMETPPVRINNDFVTLLLDLSKNFSDASSTASQPIISGVVYIQNDSAVEESQIRDRLQPKYPNLKFIFEKVTKAYSAEFVFRNPDTGINEYVNFRDGRKEESVQKISADAYKKDNDIWFSNPFNMYAPIRNHYDFIGWSTIPGTADEIDGATIITNIEEWNQLSIDPEQYDYVFYAIFRIHEYEVIFYDGDGERLAAYNIAYGTTGIVAPPTIPYKNDSELDLCRTYSFIGYTDNAVTNKVVDLQYATVRNTTEYYPVFEEISVYDNVHPEYFEVSSSYGTKGVVAGLKYYVKGKLTIPTMLEGKPILALNSSFRSRSDAPVLVEMRGQDLTHVFFEKDTQIEKINDYAFYGSDVDVTPSKLVFIEFPDTLLSLGAYAFSRCPLDYSAINSDPSLRAQVSIAGNNINEIGHHCFLLAFTKNSPINTLSIGSNVISIGEMGFGNVKCVFDTLRIGTANAPSKLELASDVPRFSIQNTVPYTVQFYTSKTFPNIDMSKVFAGGSGYENIL